MPPFVAWLIQANEYVWGKVWDNLHHVPATMTLGVMSDIVHQLYQATAMLAWSLESLVQSFAGSYASTTQAMNRLDDAFKAHESAMDHIVYDIIPNSTHHATGRLYNSDIAPLKQRVADLESRLDGDETHIDGMQGNLNDLNGWRKNRADPLLNGYEQFVQWWNANFSNPAATLIDWLQHPDHFATWATPPLIGPIIAYLSDPAHKQTRDALASVLTNAWQEEPDTIWGELQNWLVAQP